MSCTISSSDKWMGAVIGGILFAVISSPFAYNLTSSLCEMVGLGETCRWGCPNMTGLALHSVVFALITRAVLAFRGSCLTTKNKWIISLICGLMFFILSSPYAYKLETDILEKIDGRLDIADIRGCPSTSGLAVNGVIFAILSRVFMF